MNIEKATEIAEEILSLYYVYGHQDYIGEPVSQLEHMSQCAQLAEAAGADEEVVLAAFFHDIGHICPSNFTAAQMNGFGTVDHEKIGADFILMKGFSARIAKLIKSHVPAKRYLTYKYPKYYNQLSEASKKTLEFQGGKMTDAEAKTLEADEDFSNIIRLRKWDEEAKLENIRVGDLQRYKIIMVSHLANQ